MLYILVFFILATIGTDSFLIRKVNISVYINQLHQGSSKPIVHNLPKMVAETPLGVKEGKRNGRSTQSSHACFSQHYRRLGARLKAAFSRAEVMPVRSPSTYPGHWVGAQEQPLRQRRVTQEGDPKRVAVVGSRYEGPLLWVMAPWAREGEEGRLSLERQRWKSGRKKITPKLRPIFSPPVLTA